jgi:hypothetical protein
VGAWAAAVSLGCFLSANRNPQAPHDEASGGRFPFVDEADRHQTSGSPMHNSLNKVSNETKVPPNPPNSIPRCTSSEGMATVLGDYRWVFRALAFVDGYGQYSGNIRWEEFH